MSDLRSYENAALLMLGGCFALVFFDRLGLMFLMPFVAAELSLSNMQIGMLSSGLALAWAVSGMACGSLIDRSRRRKALLITMVVGFSLCTGLSGLAAGFASLLAVRIVMGLVEGPVLPLAQTLMGQASSPGRLSFNLSVLQNGFSSILALTLGPPLLIGLAGAIGWRHALLTASVPGMLIALAMWRWLREPPLPARKAVTAKVPASWRAMLSERNIVIGMVVATCLVTWVMMMMSFTPVHLVARRQYAPADMGLVMAMFGLGNCVWSIAAARLADRFGRKPVIAGFALLSLLTPVIMLSASGASVGMLALLVLVTISAGGCLPLVMAVIPAETVGPQRMATAMGLIMGTSEVLGGVLMPVLAGLAADTWGPAAPFVIAAGAAVMAALASFALVETRPRDLLRPLPAGSS